MLLDGSLFSVFRIVPTLKSAMENGSLCQVLLNKDFFQYGCNRVHLSSSSYVVMVARIVTQKRQGLAPTSFFPFSLHSLFVVQGISRYHTIWDLLFKATTIYIVYGISGWKIYQKATLNLSMQSLSSNEQFLPPGPSVACLQLGRGGI